MDIYNNKDSVVNFSVDYDRCIIGDTSTVLNALNGFLEDSQTVSNGKNRVAISFEGFDSDPRPAYDIPGIRDYVSKLDTEFPYWFYFCNLESQSIQLICLCLCEVEKVRGGSRPDADDLRKFLEDHLKSMNELGARYNLSENEIIDRSEEVLAIFGVE